MARKIKFVKLLSRNFAVLVCYEHNANDGRPYWFVRNRESCADTESSHDMEAYRKLKSVWRKSKEDFESACRFMDFKDLFSTAGVKI